MQSESCLGTPWSPSYEHICKNIYFWKGWIGLDPWLKRASKTISNGILKVHNAWILASVMSILLWYHIMILTYVDHMCNILYYTVLYCIILYSIILYYTYVYCIILYYTIWSYYTPYFTIFIAILLVSKVPTLSLKKISITPKATVFLLLLIGIIFIALLSYTFETLLIFGLTYLISIPISIYIYKYKNKEYLQKISEEDHEDIL